MSNGTTPRLSVVMPARNEAAIVAEVIGRVQAACPDAEIIVVDDGSDDGTGAVAEAAGARVVRHPVSLGNGAAVKAGARAASGEILVLLDADGQHDPADIPRLVERLAAGYDMAIGARGAESHAGRGRLFANAVYNRLASGISGHRIVDLTSGFRAVRAELFRRFLYLLPNGFSYPTTITMAFLRSGFPIDFLPIAAAARVGTSHIRPLRDGLRFFVIIFKVATLYSPLKIFVPVSAAFFLTGIGYYAYTYATSGRFTNMSLLVLSASVIVFLIGLISEQITALTYSRS